MMERATHASIPRPFLGASPRSPGMSRASHASPSPHRPHPSRAARVGAAMIAALARTIEFSMTVLHRIPLPVQSVRPSLLRDGPVIFVANHRSLLDTPFIRWSMPREVKRQLATVGGYDFFEPRSRGLRRLFEQFVLRFIVHGYRVWMIDRRLDGAAHLAPLTSLLEQGWSLLLYPEGRRSRTSRMGPMQPGAALLALRTGAPIIPMFITGSDRVLRPGVPWPRSATVSIRVGEPMRPLAGEHAEAFMQRVRSAVARLSDGMEPAFPSMRIDARERAA